LDILQKVPKPITPIVNINTSPSNTIENKKLNKITPIKIVTVDDSSLPSASNNTVN
jgi:hypothetical protein